MGNICDLIIAQLLGVVKISYKNYTRKKLIKLNFRHLGYVDKAVGICYNEKKKNFFDFLLPEEIFSVY